MSELVHGQRSTYLVRQGPCGSWWRWWLRWTTSCRRTPTKCRHGAATPVTSKASSPAAGGMKLEASLKDTEKKLAAPKIWQRLSGSAKSVVRHLDPTEFGRENGLTQLLEVLRSSPLQRLPVPDSFQRLERWSSLRRTPTETIAQLLVGQRGRALCRSSTSPEACQT